MSRFFVRYKTLSIIVLAVLALLLVKVWWLTWSCRGNGSFDREKTDLLQRRNYLLEKIIVEPGLLIREMPEAVGPQFQGEWALYSCSMFTEALRNMAALYPETKDEAITAVDSLIQIVLSAELREYDAARWGEDPLSTLDGDKSHMSYLSHLAWMIGNYRLIGGDDKYNALHDSLCSTMNRRILQSPIMNILTYPGEAIYVPDMLVAIVALKDYATLTGGTYGTTVDSWVDRARNEWLDDTTGLLVSFLDDNGKIDMPLKGSYAALNCYYLTKVAPDFAKEQYEILKDNFRQKAPVAGIKEYLDDPSWFGMDYDAGPIIFKLSPSGTAFTIGSATYFDDKDFRNQLLRTAEIAGHTVAWRGRRHYLLADIAPVGEAIALAMRTNKRPDDSGK